MAGKPGRSGKKFVAEAARMALLDIDGNDPEGRRYVHVIMRKLVDMSARGDIDAAKLLLRYAEAPPAPETDDEDELEKEQRASIIRSMHEAKAAARDAEALIIEGNAVRDSKGIEYQPAIPALPDQEAVGVHQGRRDGAVER